MSVALTPSARMTSGPMVLEGKLASAMTISSPCPMRAMAQQQVGIEKGMNTSKHGRSSDAHGVVAERRRDER